MFDITSFRGRHSLCVATFLDMVKSALIASLPHPPNTSTTKGMHDHPLRAHASSFLDHECLAFSPTQLHDHRFEPLLV